jgi:hypothetical protein
VCGFIFIGNSNEVPSDLGNSFFRLVSGFNLVWMGLDSDRRTYEGVWDSMTSKPSGRQDLEDLS